MTDFDRAIGYDESAMISRGSLEFLSSFGIGKVAQGGGYIGKTLFVADTTGNLVTAGRGGISIRQEGLNWKNGTQTLGGLLGLGGNLLGTFRGYDPSSSLNPKAPITVSVESIRRAMVDAPLVSQQYRGISLPIVERYVRLLEAGQLPPPIKVDGNIIVDGNHRYVAGRLFGQEPPIQPWLGGNPNRVIPWSTLPIVPKDWGNQ